MEGKVEGLGDVQQDFGGEDLRVGHDCSLRIVSAKGLEKRLASERGR
jgi:hypothetical protein